MGYPILIKSLVVLLRRNTKELKNLCQFLKFLTLTYNTKNKILSFNILFVGNNSITNIMMVLFSLQLIKK